MTHPQLSVCIATLNRAKFIGETLDSIISQATDEVEIVIVDGGSSDNTAEIVEQYHQKFPRLHYLKLLKKGGVDQDYCRAVELASGDYCWLLVNAEVRTTDFAKQLAPSRIAVKTDQLYGPTEPDRNRLMADVGNYLSFIGAVVVDRAEWRTGSVPFVRRT